MKIRHSICTRGPAHFISTTSLDLGVLRSYLITVIVNDSNDVWSLYTVSTKDSQYSFKEAGLPDKDIYVASSQAYG